ncbi:hypothetical protein A4X03_0g7387 [Tilletia caries]|uniref:Uncharacterized protein n=3 Tax=Tilletia TaxID=13289 RepID=A0A177V590_9BASI|nr:hypothetical protein A4X03_0g7387 [Tilletia caries]
MSFLNVPSSEAAQRDAVWSSLQEELRAAFPAMGSVDQQSATGAPAGSGAQPAASAHFPSQEWNNIQPVPGSQPGPQGFSGMGSGVFPVGTAPQAQQQPVQAPLARQQRQKGSFRYDPARAAAAVRLSPFDRSPVDIPPDLVTLFENGYHVPFCLLSLAGILQYHRGARTSFPTPLDSAAQRQLEAYLKIDRLYLRFEDWTASAMCFGVLVSHVCSSPSESAPDTNAEVQTWLEHAYTILSLQHGDNWPVLREYDFRVREAMATAMRDGSAMAFDIRSVNRPLLDMSAEMVQAKAKSFLDTEGALASELAKLLQAPASEHAAIVNVGRASSSSGGTQVSPKRKAACLPSTGGGPKALGPPSNDSFRPGGIRWCPICCQHTDKHGWSSCQEPAAGADKLIKIAGSKAWFWHNLRQSVCINYNCNLECSTKKPAASADGSTPSCPFGHYCTRCGGAHRSIHGVCTVFAAAEKTSA